MAALTAAASRPSFSLRRPSFSHRRPINPLRRPPPPTLGANAFGRQPALHPTAPARRRPSTVTRAAAEDDALGGGVAVQSDLLRPDEAAEQPSRSPSPSVSAVLQYAAVHAAALGVLVLGVRMAMDLPATLTALTLLDYFGTMVFACGGSIIAGESGMDFMGCLLMGTCSGIGGGTLRDVLLGRIPVFWVRAVEYLFICLAAAALAFANRRRASDLLSRQPYSSMMLWGDTIGLAAFATIGAQFAITAGLHPLMACISAMFSGTFGGFIRDVCCRRPPVVLTREIYATAAFCGGGAYCAVWACSHDAQLAILAGFCCTVLTRATAANFSLGLPQWSPVP